MKVNRAIPIILFVSGIAIQLAALFGEHAQEIPFVIKVIAPSYYRANTRIETLLKNRSLASTDEGFPEILRFLLNGAREWDNSQLPYEKLDFKVSNISCMGEFRAENTPHGDVHFTSDDIRFLISTVTNRFVDGAGHFYKTHEYHYQLASLREKVEQFKQPNLLVFCFGMFILGTLIETVAFYLECKESEEAGHEQGSQ